MKKTIIYSSVAITISLILGVFGILIAKELKQDKVGAYLPPHDFLDIGSANNLGQNLNDTAEFVNNGGYSSIALQITVPTGGEVCFEGTYDDINWVSFTLRDVANDLYATRTNDGTPFIGSVAGSRRFRLRTCVPGSAPGTAMGRFSRDASTIEGQEFTARPDQNGTILLHNSITTSTQLTGLAIVSPTTSTKKFVLTDISLIVGGITDGTITIFDETNTQDNVIFKGTIDVSNNKQFVWNHNFSIPIKADVAGNSLRITTSANMTVDVFTNGYEI